MAYESEEEEDKEESLTEAIIEKEVLKCNKCDFTSTVVRNMEDHTKKKHQERNSYQCENCNFTTDKKEECDNHMKNCGREKLIRNVDFLIKSKAVNIRVSANLFMRI